MPWICDACHRPMPTLAYRLYYREADGTLVGGQLCSPACLLRLAEHLVAHPPPLAK